MAENIVDISILSPFQFTKRGYENAEIYNTHWKEDYQYIDTLGEWDETKEYYQPWQKADIIPFQIISTYAPHQLDLFDCEGNQVASFVLAYESSSIEVTGQKIYKAEIALNTFDDGIYRFVISSGNPVIDIHDGNWFSLKQKHKSTILIESTHDENDFDTVFENGFVAKLRIHGKVGEYTPASNRIVFIDQPANITQLNANGFSTEVFIIGDQWGVPDIFIEKINTHFRCFKVMLDNKQYSGTEGARFEAQREDNFPMTGWRFEIRASKASTKTRSVASEVQGSPTTVTYNIENKGFGPISNPASQNVIQIINLD